MRDALRARFEQKYVGKLRWEEFDTRGLFDGVDACHRFDRVYSRPIDPVGNTQRGVVLKVHCTYHPRIYAGGREFNGLRQRYYILVCPYGQVLIIYQRQRWRKLETGDQYPRYWPKSKGDYALVWTRDWDDYVKRCEREERDLVKERLAAQKSRRRKRRG